MTSGGTTLSGARILVTGPTGQVALPLTRTLAAANDVWGIARFSDAFARQQLESAGVTCVQADLATADFRDLPTDFDYVLNLAVTKEATTTGIATSQPTVSRSRCSSHTTSSIRFTRTTSLARSPGCSRRHRCPRPS